MGGGLYGDATGPANADSGQAHASNAWVIRVNPRSASSDATRGSWPLAGSAVDIPIQSSYFKVVVLVGDRLACGEPRFPIAGQAFRTRRTLWDGAPEVRGWQTTTRAWTLRLWMTVQLFKKSPQGCHGGGQRGPWDARGARMGRPARPVHCRAPRRCPPAMR